MAIISGIFDKDTQIIKKSQAYGALFDESKLEKNAISSPIKKENGVNILKFPLIDDSDARAKKTIRLVVLKQQTWEDITSIASNAGVNYKESIDEAGGISSFVVGLGSNLVEGAKSAFSGDIKRGIGSIKESVDTIVNPLGKAVKDVMKDLSDPANYNSEQIECVFQLPIPNNLLESENHNYTGGKFDDSDIVSAATKPYQEMSKVIDSAAQMTSQMVQKEGRRTSKPVPQMPVLNPFLYQKYEGSETKEYSLVFFLVPRNKEEAQQAMKISYLLKKYSYPSKSKIKGTDKDGREVTLDTIFLTPPNKILIKFQNEFLQKLINPGVCVIKTIQTTYNEGTTVGMTADGVPRFIEINMTLTEYNQKYQEDFK